MAKPNPWTEMSIEEKLDAVRHDEQSRQRDAAAMAKTLDQLRRRVEDIERRLEEMVFI